MLKRFLSIGAAALTALAGGCGEGPSSVTGGYRNAATWSSFVHATSSGPLLLRVVGEPFGQGASSLERAVAESMAMGIPARPFTLTLDPGLAPVSRFRVTLVLGAPPGLDERSVCAGQPQVTAVPKGGRLELMATFCDGDALLSSVRGWVTKVEDSSDRRFRLLMGEMARALMGDPQ